MRNCAKVLQQLRGSVANNKDKLKQDKYVLENLLKDCVGVIEQLQEQLARSVNINKQQGQLIRILTIEKEYYRKEDNSVSLTELTNIRQQLMHNATLINALKQYNRQLTQRVKELLDIVQEKTMMLVTQQKQSQQWKDQKELIQKEWKRVVMAIGERIRQIEGNKENELGKRNKGKRVLKEKVQCVLEEIDSEIMIKDLKSLLKGKQSHKHHQTQYYNIDTHQSTKSNSSNNSNTSNNISNQPSYSHPSFSFNIPSLQIP